ISLYTLSLHDALPISRKALRHDGAQRRQRRRLLQAADQPGDRARDKSRDLGEQPVTDARLRQQVLRTDRVPLQLVAQLLHVDARSEEHTSELQSLTNL